MKLSFMKETFLGKYGYCLDEEKNVSAKGNRQCLNYFDKKIACSQKEQKFTEAGHYLFDYVPTLYSEDDWFDDKSEKRNGVCEIGITDMFTKEKLTYQLKLETMFPNKRYLHGMMKNENKKFGGVTLLIDNCLHSYSEVEKSFILNHKELVAGHCRSLPVVDVGLTYIRAKWRNEQTFFGQPSTESYELEEQLKKRLNDKKKYVYGVFKIDEYWLIPLANGEINELYTSKFIIVQSFSESWLLENSFPVDTPVLAQSGDSHSDRLNFSYGHYYMKTEEVIAKEKAMLIANIDKDRKGYFIVPKGYGCSGRRYLFNKKPKWGKNNPRPHCFVSGYPLFASNF